MVNEDDKPPPPRSLTDSHRHPSTNYNYHSCYDTLRGGVRHGNDIVREPSPPR